MNEMKRERPVAADTARSAQSLASEPECPNHTRRSPRPGVSRKSSSANATAFSLGKDSRLAPAMSAQAVVTASVTAGGGEAQAAARPEEDKSGGSRPPP